MSTPFPDFLDLPIDGANVTQMLPFRLLNEEGISSTRNFFGVTDTVGINHVALDYQIGYANLVGWFQRDLPLERADGVSLQINQNFSFLAQGGQFSWDFDRAAAKIDILTLTNENDRLMIRADQGPEIIDLAGGDDSIFLNGYSAWVSLGGGDNSFVSTDDKADFVTVRQDFGWGTTEQNDPGHNVIVASAGSLVIANEGDEVRSITGNNADITRMTMQELQATLLDDALGFFAKHDQIDIGLVLSALQDDREVWTSYGDYNNDLGTHGIFTTEFIPYDTDIGRLYQAFTAINHGEYAQAHDKLAELGLGAEETSRLFFDLADTFDMGVIRAPEENPPQVVGITTAPDFTPV